MDQVWIIALAGLSIWLVKYFWDMPSLPRMVRVFVALYFSIWYVTPLILAGIFGYDALADDVKFFSGLTGYDFAGSATLEIFGIFSIMLATSYLRRGKKPHELKTSQLPLNISMTLTLATAAALTYYSISNFGRSSYAELNDSLNYDADRANILIAAVAALSPFGYALLILKALKPASRAEYLVAQTTLVLNSIFFVLTGSRIGIILPVIPLIVRLSGNNLLSMRNFGFAVVGSIVLFMVVLPLSAIIGTERTYGDIQASAVLSGDSFTHKEYMQMLFGKFDSYSAAEAITNRDLSRDSGIGVAGFEPYVGSILVFMPRGLFRDRPVAGSIDGTLEGTPSRVGAFALNPSASTSQNVGVLPFHVAIWEFGYLLGWVALIAANALGLFATCALLESGKFRYNIGGLYLVGLPTLGEFISSPDVIIRKFVTLAGFLILAEIIAFMAGGGLKRGAGTRRAI